MANSPEGSPAATYWYDQTDSAAALLVALRRFRVADHRMRQQMSSAMSVNATDMAALRHVIAHELDDDPATPATLAQSLAISTASTAKRLNRLTASGHLRRVPHPRDRRSVIVVATELTHREVRRWLSGLHEGMLGVADEVPEEARAAVADFLLAMASFMDATTAELAESDDAGWGGEITDPGGDRASGRDR